MAGENFALGISFKGNAQNFIGAAAKAEAKMEGFARATIGATSRMANGFITLSQSAAGMLGGLATGAGLMMAGNAVIDFDARLARLANNAGLSRREMYALKGSLFEVAHATKQSEQGLLSSIEEIVSRTGNYDYALKVVKDLGIVASASGASLDAVGGAAADLMQKMEIPADKMLATFDILAAQGKAGAFELRNMAQYFPSMLAQAAAAGVKGTEGMRKFGAFIQIAKQGVGTAAEASTAIERTFTDIRRNAELLERSQIKLTVKHNGKDVPRDFDQILKEIIVKTKGDARALGKVFDVLSIQAILPLAASYKKFGDFRVFDEMATKGGDGAMIMKDFGFWTEQTRSKLDELHVTMREFSNARFAGPIEKLNEALAFLSANPALAKAALWGGMAMGGAILGGATLAGGKQIYDVLKGSGKTAGGIGGEMAAALAIQKVFVTNWPKSMGGSGVNGPLPSGPKTPDVPVPTKAPGWLNRQAAKIPGIGKMLAGGVAAAPKPLVVAGVITTAGTGYMAGKGIEEHFIDGWYGKKAYDSTHGGERKLANTQNFLLESVQPALAAGDQELARTIIKTLTNLPSIEGAANKEKILDSLVNRITIAVHVDKEGKGRVITEGKNTTTRIHNPGSFD